MSLVGRGYLAMVGRGDPETARDTLKRLGRRLDGLYDKASLDSYVARVLYNTDSITEEWLNEKEVLAVSENTLPVVYLNINFNPQSFFYDALEKLEAEFDLRMLNAFYVPPQNNKD